MKRITHTFHAFDLSLRQNRVRLLVGGAVGAKVAARTESPTWATSTLRVMIENPAGPSHHEFPSGAKSIPAGGGIVAISADDMAGVRGIVIEQSGDADAGGATATIAVTVDHEDESED